jgi:hypothetical protein
LHPFDKFCCILTDIFLLICENLVTKNFPIVSFVVGELSLNQERHYGRVVMTAYMGAVVGPDLISSKMAAKAVWQFITGSSVHNGSEDNIIAAMWALHCCDKDIVMDMRTMNGKAKDDAFVPFWEELKRQLESYKTVHSRRHAGKCP